MKDATTQKPRFLIGHFEPGLNHKNGMEQFRLEIFWDSVQTTFVTDLAGPIPQNGEVWLFQPGQRIFASKDDARQILIANLERVIADRQNVTVTFTPSKRRVADWEFTEQKDGLTIKFIPDRASVCRPSESGCQRFNGEIKKLVYYDQPAGFAIVSVRLTEPAPTSTALRHAHNPAHAKKLAELESQRQRAMNEAKERHAFADTKRAQRDKGGKQKNKTGQGKKNNSH